MTFPTMKQLFNIKESVDNQHWTSNGKRYNIGKLYSWARQNGHDVEIIPISNLKAGFDRTKTDEKKDSDAFWKRADAAGDDPILVVVDDMGMEWIADGNHRFARNERDGQEGIAGYRVNERDLPEDAIEPKEK